MDSDSKRMAVANPRDLESFNEHWAKILGDQIVIAKVILVEGVVVGSISCFKMEGQDAIGYWIGKDFLGKGIATRSLDVLLHNVPTRPLNAWVPASNIASNMVLERCGFVKTGSRMSPRITTLLSAKKQYLNLADPSPFQLLCRRLEEHSNWPLVQVPALNSLHS